MHYFSHDFGKQFYMSVRNM